MFKTIFLWHPLVGIQKKTWQVVEPPLWKMMEFVNGKDDIPYMKWKNMFETTNQYIPVRWFLSIELDNLQTYIKTTQEITLWKL